MQNIFNYQFENGNQFNESDVRSRVGGSTSGLGMLLTWDNRNDAFAPDKGFFAELNITSYHKIIKSRYNFIAFTLDMRKFVSIDKSSVIAIQDRKSVV